MDKLDKLMTNYFSEQSLPKGLLEEIRAAKEEEAPPAFKNSAKNLFPDKNKALTCPHCRKSITAFKKPVRSQSLWNTLWLGLSVICFILSFIFKQFFIQWVAFGFLSTIKYIVDQKSTKTQILIYKALQEEADSSARRRNRLDVLNREDILSK